MEMVDDYDGKRYIFLVSGDERELHVRKYRPEHVCVQATFRRLDEGGKALLALSFGDIYHPAALQVVEGRDLYVAFLHRELINDKLFDLAMSMSFLVSLTYHRFDMLDET